MVSLILKGSSNFVTLSPTSHFPNQKVLVLLLVLLLVLVLLLSFFFVDLPSFLPSFLLSSSSSRSLSFPFQAAPASSIPPSLEFQIVQDADRLDAIGAIGIARCLTFGGARGRSLYDAQTPKLEDWQLGEAREGGAGSGSSSTVDHFFDKLLKLKVLMNTESAKKLAQARHDFMLVFLKQMEEEIQGRT
jgi:hypothetical protein